jgi:hypothetical protein
MFRTDTSTTRATVARCAIAVILTVAGAVAAHPRALAQPPDKKTPPSSEELAAITARGRLLAAYDRACWDASDAVQAAHPNPTKGQRFIAHQTDKGWAVDFGALNEAGDRFELTHEAVSLGAGATSKLTVQTFNPLREEIGWNLAAAKAIATALKDFQHAPRPYNYAVLPAESGELYVYLYPAQTQKDVYPIGGDARYRISADGSNVLEKRQMHKSIIDSNTSSTNGKKLAAGYHTHVLSDVPEDTDILMVLSREPSVPELVMTASFTYNIATDGSIKVEKR